MIRNRPVTASFRRAPQDHGFSLVEVVLAIGILAFAITVIVALFASLSNQRRDVSQHREAVLVVATLNTYLNDEVAFETVYDWVQSGSAKELVHVRYRADGNQNPSSTGEHVISGWFDPASDDLTDYEAARRGNWTKAILAFDGGLHPDSSPLPTASTDWPYAHLLLRVELRAVPDPRFTPGPHAIPITTTTVGVAR